MGTILVLTHILPLSSKPLPSSAKILAAFASSSAITVPQTRP
ncbi:hypothetical protein PPTG_24713 [Phytophthora nicotianae INRA-310]|uniref:Uncharacterized protein n=1 Tax=Phytophthora nicotianae (strain INRA-310) TaxID=761204 RepID=W2PBF3_PHYN3|nr:hypothetical protein PPTG_24713 [Phytophthora nicotianae INRA-310]ETM98166.1 hypothetical protein PPTG_24713 [Phytophthora nicotianae INRA-310]